MKRILSAFCVILLAVSCSREDFPGFGNDNFDTPMQGADKGFAEFCFDNYDTDRDGIITREEVENVRTMDCSSSGIVSLNGIQYFPNLDTLICDNNLLQEVNLGLMPKLKYLSCKGNRIETLDLRDSAVDYVYCAPMENSDGENILQFVYVYRDQDFKELDVPEDTFVISFPR